MTGQRDIERVLERWLDDGIDEMPDRVYRSVLDRVERQPQRRAWRLLPWRFPAMSTPLKLIAAGAALLVVLFGGGVLFSGGAGPSPTPSPTPTPTPVPSRTPTLNVGGPCGAIGSTCRGALEAGTYSSQAYRPPLTFTVPDGWFNKFDDPRSYGLMPATEANLGSSASEGESQTSLELQNDLAVHAGDCSEAAETGVGTTAADIVDHLAGLRTLDATSRRPVSFGGLSGQAVDLAGASGVAMPCGGSQPILIDPDRIGTGVSWGVAPGERWRLILLDRPDGGTITVSIFSTGEEGWSSYRDEAQGVVDTFEFAPE